MRSEDFDEQWMRDYTDAIQRFIDADDTVRIDGSYRGDPATFFTNYDTGQVVVLDRDGTFRTALFVEGRKYAQLWYDSYIGVGLP